MCQAMSDINNNKNRCCLMPGKRKRNPDWIGLVPDLGRGTAFATVFAMCAFQIFAKAAGTALLAVTNPAWLW